MHQTLQVTDFDTPNIEKCIENIHKINRIFSLNFFKGAMQQWEPHYYNEHKAIDVANRYFTNRHDKGSLSPILFTHEVDPDGILAGAMKDDLLHLEENKVKYYELVKGENGLHKYIKLYYGTLNIITNSN
jgi:hypothetical protein